MVIITFILTGEFLFGDGDFQVRKTIKPNLLGETDKSSIPYIHRFGYILHCLIHGLFFVGQQNNPQSFSRISSTHGIFLGSGEQVP
jgi:hypothetical protein